MKLEIVGNPNYAAVMMPLPPLRRLDGLDNLLGASMLGYQALVSNDHVEGEPGVMFPPECQLSDDFCKTNNLYRKGVYNADPEATGYIELNRRVKAIKLRGNRSDCLWMPIAAFRHLGDLPFSPGTAFDTIDGQEICRKYVIREPRPNSGARPKTVKPSRVDERHFPLHFDTTRYWGNEGIIGPDEWVYVTVKLHGSSFRAARPLVNRSLTRRDRIARKFGVKVAMTEHDTIYGSRKVTKDPLDLGRSDFYDSDIWGAAGERIAHAIHDGWIVFGEIVGWTANGSPIQGDYTYGQPQGTLDSYIYRVASINAQGVSVDLSFPQVQQWCDAHGLKPVPLLWQGYHRDFKAEEWLDRRFADEGFATPPLAPKLVDEGVCIRAERAYTPIILKAKSPIFLQAESKWLDSGIIDTESSQEEA